MIWNSYSPVDVPIIQAPRIVYKGVRMSTVVNVTVFELYCVY